MNFHGPYYRIIAASPATPRYCAPSRHFERQRITGSDRARWPWSQRHTLDGQDIWCQQRQHYCLGNKHEHLDRGKTISRGGARPTGIPFDGANGWITNFNSNSIAKIRIRDGAPLSTFGTSLAPVCPVYDGTNIWVANRGSGTVTKLRASDGANQGTFPTGCSTPNHYGL